MTLLQGAAVITVTVLAGLAIVQVLLAAGRPLGALAWGGAYRVLPPGLRVASAATVVIYAAFAAVLLLRAQVVSGAPDHPVIMAGAWVAMAVFALGIPANAMSKSRWERSVMLPASGLLAAATLLIALPVG